MTFRHLFLIIAQGFLLAALPARAGGDGPHTAITGFGTLGGLYQSHGAAGFVRDLGQTGEPGRKYDWRPDSRLGIQLTHTLSPRLQLVGQAVLRDQPERNPATVISRAFLAYRPQPDFQLRIGRLPDSVFFMSEYYEVGYAFPWARPPVEAYTIMALRHYDGADFTYTLPLGESVWRFKGLAGQVKAEVPHPVTGSYVFEAHDLRGVALINERGPLKLRASYNTLHLDRESSITPFLQGPLEAFAVLPANPHGREARALSKDLPMKGARLEYASMGLSYDDDGWMLQAEIGNLSAGTNLAPQGTMGFVSVGRHFGAFLPYGILGRWQGPDIATAQGDWGSLLTPLQTNTLAAINAPRSSQSSASLGVRWDFHRQAALKLQWDHIHVGEQGWGLWKTLPAFDGRGGRANVLSATLDFVF